MDHQQSWTNMWRGLGAARVAPELLPALLNRYAEPHRKYHTLQHLDACFAHFNAVRREAAHPQEVELAIWFHDAVYEIGGAQNESQSADWARGAMLAAGVSADAAQRVYSLVMATNHHVSPKTADEALLLDIDLAILGAPAPGFDAYEDQVRAEYASVPEDAFRGGRRRILQAFLARERIFLTPHFRDRLEAQARANLARSIDSLRTK